MRPCTSVFAPGACACSERAARPKRGWDLSGQREDRVGRRRITHEQAHVARGIAALVQGMRDPEALLPTHPEPSVSALIAHQRSEEHTSELQSRVDLVCRLLLEKKKH